MSAVGGHPDPRAFRVAAMLIFEHTIDNENLFAGGMAVQRDLAAGGELR